MQFASLQDEVNFQNEDWEQRERMSAVYGMRDSEQVPGPSNPELNIPEYMRTPPSYQGKGAWSNYTRHPQEPAAATDEKEEDEPSPKDSYESIGDDPFEVIFEIISMPAS